MKLIEKSHKLDNVCYDIRGKIHQEACRMEDEGVRILKLNIGNMAAFGFEAPEEVIRDVIRNMPISQGYCESNGIFSARKAIAQYYQQKGLKHVDVEDVFIGNARGDCGKEAEVGGTVPKIFFVVYQVRVSCGVDSGRTDRMRRKWNGNRRHIQDSGDRADRDDTLPDSEEIGS